MQRPPCLLLSVTLFATLVSLGADYSPVKADETVILFPTSGYLTDDGATWVVPVHAWIFEREAGSVWRAGALAAFRKSLDLPADAEESELLRERGRYFLADNERGKRLIVRLGETSYRLPASGPNGHIVGEVRLLAETGRAWRDAKGWIDIEVVLPPRDERRFDGQAQLLEPAGLSVVSDIDDTIKVSHVGDLPALIRTTFTEPYEAVPGMASRYTAWAEAGAAFHYVSASPWQLFPPLASWMKQAGFPEGEMVLKSFRWKDRSFANLFADPELTKLAVLRPLFARFPQRTFILVGDSTERDPEVYGQLAREFPGQVRHIYIRLVGADADRAARWSQAFAGVPRECWSLLTDPAAE